MLGGKPACGAEILMSAQATAANIASAASQAFVNIQDVAKYYPVSVGGWKKAHVRSLDGVSLAINQGEVVGLVGESGCGKSTLAKVILRLVRPDRGSVSLDGRDLSTIHGEELRQFRTSMQLVFQHPQAALDPRMRIGTSLEQPLAQHNIGNAAERKEMVANMLQEVGLNETFIPRYPSHCSGGELQRVIIARALLLKPRFLVCDEPTSALDASLRAQVINLLVDLKKRFDLTLLIISHDLRVMRCISDRVAVMYLGKIVETGTRDAIFNTPAHPYTRALIAASLLEENGLAAADDIRGEPPSPINPPPGCHFHPRCPIAQDSCAQREPGLVDTGQDHHSACFFADRLLNRQT